MTPGTLEELHAECFTAPRPWTASEFEGLLGTPGTYLCGEEGGFALGRVISDEAELLTIAVAPAFRRSGLGRKLLRAHEAEACGRGAVSSFLEVASDNAAAIALYETQGYALCGRRRGYYRGAGGGPVDALTYRRDLG